METTFDAKDAGAVKFGKDDAWASYNVHPDLLHAGLTLPDGRAIQLFVNRTSGLIVVDVIAKNGRSGNEIFRKTV